MRPEPQLYTLRLGDGRAVARWCKRGDTRASRGAGSCQERFRVHS